MLTEADPGFPRWGEDVEEGNCMEILYATIPEVISTDQAKTLGYKLRINLQDEGKGLEDNEYKRTVLTYNPITNFYFDGIFSLDTLAFVKEPELIICNTDPSNKAGEHFFVRGKSVDCYDSLGRDINYYGSLFLDFY